MAKIESVLGEINVDDIGCTLTHEHLHMQFDCSAARVPENLEKIYPINEKESTFHLKNLGILRQYPYGSKFNLKLDDNESKNIMLDEILRFKQFGGKTIVENTIYGISRNIEFLKQLSLESGLNIIAGTGFYIDCSHTAPVLNYSVEDMCAIMAKELIEGCDNSRIKCGIIGEIGSSWPITDFERKAIQATAIVQEQTKAPVTFHPGRNSKAPFEIIRIFEEAGGKREKAVMSHLDRTLLKEEDLLEFASLKTYTQYDLFGTECSHYQLGDMDMPSDADRIKKLKILKENGHISQILMSHDIHTKHRLVNFGGHGFAHILQNILPKMKNRGFSEEDIKMITVENPKRWLSG